MSEQGKKGCPTAWQRCNCHVTFFSLGETVAPGLVSLAWLSARDCSAWLFEFTSIKEHFWNAYGIKILRLTGFCVVRMKEKTGKQGTNLECGDRSPVLHAGHTRAGRQNLLPFWPQAHNAGEGAEPGAKASRFLGHSKIKGHSPCREHTFFLSRVKLGLCLEGLLVLTFQKYWYVS